MESPVKAAGENEKKVPKQVAAGFDATPNFKAVKGKVGIRT
jgi:hypothetical protein